MPRLYSRAEAEALLPVLTPILESIRAAYAELGEHEQALGSLLQQTRNNGHGVDTEAVERTRRLASETNARLSDLLTQLEAHDVELKDPATGLIDFQSRRQGRIVYLCWRLGEPRIEWWHELDTGFAGRQRLATDE